MATKKPAHDPVYPSPGVTGPADTDDPDVRVSSVPAAPSATDLRSGTTAAVAVVLPLAPPLQLVSDPRIETYEIVAPGGTVVEVTRNIDTGAALGYVWTDRTRIGE